MVEPTGAQSIILMIRFVIANLELVNLSSRDEPAKGLLKMVSVLGSQPPQERGPLAAGTLGAAGAAGSAGAVVSGVVGGVVGAAVTLIGIVSFVRPVYPYPFWLTS
jgi:hypothetical protein